MDESKVNKNIFGVKAGISLFAAIGLTFFWLIDILTLENLNLRFKIFSALLTVLIFVSVWILISAYTKRKVESVNREKDLLKEICSHMAYTRDFDAAFNLLTTYIFEKVGFENASLAFLTGDLKHFKIKKTTVTDKAILDFVKISLPLSSFSKTFKKCILDLEPVYFKNIEEIEKESTTSYKFYKEMNIKSILAYPLMVDREPIGFLLLTSHYHHLDMGKEGLSWLFQLVGYFASILNNFKEYDKVSVRNGELEELFDIAKQISVAKNIDSVFISISKYLKTKYGFNGYGLEMLTPDKAYYIIKRYEMPDGLSSYKNKYVGAIHPVDDTGGRVAQCIMNKETYYATDVDPSLIKNLFSREVVEELKIKTVLILPIVIENEAIGVFGLRSHYKSVYLSKGDIESIENFMSQFTIMMANIKLYEKVQRKSIEVEMAYARLQKTNWELEEALQTAEDANKAKVNFLAMMSHELRTPITGMMGFSEILVNDETLAANQKEYAHIIYGCGNRLLKVVSDLLEMSTMEAGKYEIKFQNLSLKELLEDIHILYANNFEKKRIEFSVNLNGIDGIVSDEIKLRHILLNLIGNAVKFTEEGNVSICVREEKGYYVFAIKDTGIGIPEHLRTSIFDMFMQAENVECRKYEGIGLGLTICKRLVEALGGIIWIDGDPDEGSTFLFKIPLVEKKNYQLISK